MPPGAIRLTSALPFGDWPEAVIPARPSSLASSSPRIPRNGPSLVGIRGIIPPDGMAAGRSPPDWYGIGVPKKTPTEIVEKLSKEINAALADPKLKARFADLGGKWAFRIYAVRRLVHRFRETDDMRRIHGLRFLKMAA